MTQTSGVLLNNGHDVKLTVDDVTSMTSYVNMSGGPLSYQYRVAEVTLHFGKEDINGSEHSVNGQLYPGEVLTIYHTCTPSSPDV